MALWPQNKNFEAIVPPITTVMPASGDFLRMLKAFSINLDQDQTRLISRLNVDKAKEILKFAELSSKYRVPSFHNLAIFHALTLSPLNYIINGISNRNVSFAKNPVHVIAIETILLQRGP